jgi:tryptophanyl-tRNA synthetase
MRERRAEILANPQQVDHVLEQGAERANNAANKVMKRVRDAVGLRKS